MKGEKIKPYLQAVLLDNESSEKDFHHSSNKQ